jgi:ribonuclease P protein component
LANELAGPRLGITVTRKVGGAVVRNRVKRRLREIYRRWSDQPQLPALDIVIHAKPSAARATFSELATEVERQLASLPVPRGCRDEQSRH